ncbi:hypothetical protein B4Q04_09435 [Zobellia sp. OII3]|uniref:WG repeat-containing protein n=1 Tax=Zobellia sp. OII3 TaxID=2034520 RepID=UPI000B52B216|nr:WG repeat-containing protein [Zobellia sp. OII3]OWW25806.1 hypothetical protein B4Q04_09435 [Zobellia sp. OII3]
MRLFPIIASFLFFNSVFSQEEYINIDKTYDRVPDELLQKVKDNGFESSGIYFINGYLNVNKNDQSTFMDTSGNILNQLYDFKTDMSSAKIFFTGQPVTGINDIGKKEEQRYINIKAFNAMGEPVQTEIGATGDYYFSSNMASVYDHYLSADTDYFTVHYDKPDASKSGGYSLQEGLINGKGAIVLKAKYKSVRQIANDYFLLKTEDGASEIMNVMDRVTLPVKIGRILLFNEVPNVQQVNTFVSFNDKIIATDGDTDKWGVYDMANKKWSIPATYEELKPFNTFRQLGEHMKHILFTDTFFVKKEGKWGAVDSNNTTVIPFKYSKMDYNGASFIVYDENGHMNLFDIATQTELFDHFYDQINFDNDHPELAVLVSNGSVGIYDYANKSFIVDPSEGYKTYNSVNRNQNHLLKRKDAEGKDDMALFSIKYKKVIASGFRDYYVLHETKFGKIRHVDGTNSIIDMEGKTIIPPGKYMGKAGYQKGILFFYDSYGKRKKPVHCYKPSGEKVDTALCQETLSPDNKKKKKKK